MYSHDIFFKNIEVLLRYQRPIVRQARQVEPCNYSNLIQKKDRMFRPPRRTFPSHCTAHAATVLYYPNGNFFLEILFFLQLKNYLSKRKSV